MKSIDLLRGLMALQTDECVLWPRAINAKGYGCLWNGEGRVVRAHRWAWELVNGPVPEGLLVLHSCDTPACLNLRHLFVGTPLENSMDMVEKGRHPTAKLTDADVLAIRDDHRTHRAIAADYGLDHSVVTRIKSLKRKAHVAGPAYGPGDPPPVVNPPK